MLNKTDHENWLEHQLFTTGQAAKICKVSQQTIIRSFDSGRLHGFRVPGSRARRIPREGLLSFMKANDIPTDMLEGNVKRVMIVDNPQYALDMVRAVLARDERFDVQTARSGYDAGCLTAKFRPQLIVLLAVLPDLDGLTLCRRVRSTADLADTKVLVAGATADRAEAFSTEGADAFIESPLTEADLVSQVEELLQI